MNDSQLNCTMPQSECTFCDQFRDHKNNGVGGSVFGQTFNRILWDDGSFVVVSALGALVEGWLLIVPREHFLSIANLPSNLRCRFLHLKNTVALILKETYSVDPIFFEHGSFSNELPGGACIVHAHLHAVPTSINLMPDLMNQLKPRPIKSIEALWETPPNKAYVYFEHPEKIPTIAEVNVYLPCQYLRRLIANRLGVPEQWNWRSNFQKTRIMNANSKLKNKFKAATDHRNL